jgi:hypothetical protein
MITKTALAVATLLLLGIAATSPTAFASGTISACGTVVKQPLLALRSAPGGLVVA